MQATTRLDLTSADGTPIAVWVNGEGPPLVLVHGSMCDHHTFDPLVGELCRDVTTFAVDRRGFGASGDGVEYSLDREFEDVAAVVDAVAERTTERVGLFGHSYGAGCALGGATLTVNLAQLIAYEPGLGLSYPTDTIEQWEQDLEAGDAAGVLCSVLTDIVGLSEEELSALRSSPRWPASLATAPTVPREARAENEWRYDRLGPVTAPTLFLTGTDTADALAQATQAALRALPRAEVRVLEGHGHLAYIEDPALVARVIVETLKAWGPTRSEVR